MFRPGAGLTAREVLALLDFVPEGGALMASIRASLLGKPKPDGKAEKLPPPDPATAVGRARLRRQFLGWDEHHELLAQIRDGIYAQGGVTKPYPRPGQVMATVRVIVDLDDVPAGF